jgi:hypothetical protein
MSYVGSNARRVFGYDSNADVRTQAGQSTATQAATESITTTTSRAVKGPIRNGHYSAHL